MYSEFDVKKEIAAIESSDDSPIRKARRLLSLSHRLRKFLIRLDAGTGILERDEDDEGVVRMHHTHTALKRMQEESRLAAFKALKGAPAATLLSFAVTPEAAAYPSSWVQPVDQLEMQPTFN